MCWGFETGNLQSRSVHAIIFISNLKRLVNKKGCLLREDLDYRFLFFLFCFFSSSSSKIHQPNQPNCSWQGMNSIQGRSRCSERRSDLRLLSLSFQVTKPNWTRHRQSKDHTGNFSAAEAAGSAQISTLKSRSFISPTSDAKQFQSVSELRRLSFQLWRKKGEQMLRADVKSHRGGQRGNGGGDCEPCSCQKRCGDVALDGIFMLKGEQKWHWRIFLFLFLFFCALLSTLFGKS